MALARRQRARAKRPSHVVRRPMVELVYDRDMRMWVSARQEDVGTEERSRQQGGVEIVDRRISDRGIVIGRGAIALAENEVAAMDLRGELTRPGETRDDAKRRREVAEKLCRLWHRAGLAAKLGSTLREKVSSGDREMSDAADGAFAAVQVALSKLDRTDASIVVDVVCYDRGIPPARRECLLRGLDALAKHWQM